MREVNCADLNPNTNTSYPAGTVCALEDTPRAEVEPVCLTAGESGSPLMMPSQTGSEELRYHVEGLMSFTRSCRVKIGKVDSTKDQLSLLSTSPNVYTKVFQKGGGVV